MQVTVSPSLSELSDEQLIAAIGRGETDALEALYNRHARWILQRLQARCTDREIVDTAHQDTFIAVWRSAASYRATGEVGGWLWTIAVRRLIDQLRKRKAPTPIDTIPETEALASPGTEAYELLHRLPPDLHSVATAVYLDGLTTHEAGVLLGIPQGTVKSRLSRARALLNQPSGGQP